MAAPGNPNISPDKDLVAFWQTMENNRFQNYETYILKNRQYTGCIINKCEGKEYMLENHHPAIIFVDEFNKGQVEKKSNFSTTNNELKNFVKCKKCGCAMIKSSYGIHKDVYQCTNCKTWIDSQVVEDLIKKEVETNLKERKPSLVGNKLAKEKQKIK